MGCCGSKTRLHEYKVDCNRKKREVSILKYKSSEKPNDPFRSDFRFQIQPCFEFNVRGKKGSRNTNITRSTLANSEPLKDIQTNNLLGQSSILEKSRIDTGKKPKTKSVGYLKNV